MDIEKLIERLKQKDGLWCSVPTGENLIADAATALSTLKAENEKLMVRNTKLEDTIRSQRNGLQKLRAELEQVERCIEIVEHQRDEAIYDMTALMAGQCCDLCAVEYCNDRGKTEMCTAFKWRGLLKEDGHGTALQNDTLCV